MSSTPTSLWKDVRRWLPGVVISVVALIALFRLASWEDLSMAFAAIRPLNVTVAVILILVSLGTRAQAWRVLLEGRSSFSQAYFIVNAGYLLNNLFPLRAGELGRAVLMGRSAKVSPFHVLSTIVLERAFDLAMAAALLLATLPLALGMEWAKPVALVTLIAVLGGLAALYLVARYNQQVQAFLERLSQRWPFVQRYIIPRIGSLMKGLGALTHPKQFFLSVFWIAMSWVIWVCVYWIMMLPIAPEAPIWWAGFADGVLAMGIAIPSAPSALGVFEAALVGALSLLGVNPSAALAYAITMHLLQFVTTGILGFWGLAREGRSLSGVFSEIRIRGE